MRCAVMNRIIRLPFAFWLVVLVLLFAARFSLGEPYKAAFGPCEVKPFLLELQDDERGRVVPITVYIPIRSVEPMPLVPVSHGLGGTREGLGYLGNHWASHGYVCVHMQHAGSDESVWQG